METSNYNTAGGAGPYAVDMSNISVPKNIRTERELEQEVTKICDTLKDTCKDTYIYQTFLQWDMLTL